MLNLNADRGNVIFGSQWISVGGRPGIVERFGSVKLHISAGSFLQANPWIAGRLYRLAARWADGRSDDTVVDLYAGGHIGLAAQIGAGLAFAESANDWEEPERTRVELVLQDVLDQGGRLYPVESVVTQRVWYFTLPKQTVRVREIK